MCTTFRKCLTILHTPKYVQSIMMDMSTSWTNAKGNKVTESPIKVYDVNSRDGGELCLT